MPTTMAIPPQPLPILPTTETILPLVHQTINDHQALRTSLTTTLTPSTATFANTILPLTALDNTTQCLLGALHVLEDLTANETTTQALQLWRAAEARWHADADLYALVKAVQSKHEAVPDEDKLWIEREVCAFENAGHLVGSGLNLEQRTEFVKGIEELDKLTAEFNKFNQRKGEGVWFSTVAELDGVPAAVLARWQKRPDGRVFVPIEGFGYVPVLQHAKREETRKAVFLALERGAEGSGRFVREIFLLRDKQARLLGYGSHAEVKMRTAAVKDPEWVDRFLQDLKESLGEKVAEAKGKMVSALKKDAQNQGIGGGVEGGEDEFMPWNAAYAGRLIQEGNRLDGQLLEEYFPVETTKDFMLATFARFLGLEFLQLPKEQLPEGSVWDEQVQVWAVWDKDGAEPAFLGYLYLDLMWRKDKSPGYFNCNLECVRSHLPFQNLQSKHSLTFPSQGYEKPDGSRHYPSTVLCCQFESPLPNKCATLPHDKVVLLFHELGHAIHDLVSRTKYARFHGTRLADDFCETPSLLLENWCWTDMLRNMSCHYTTLNPEYLTKWREIHPGEEDPPRQMPDELLESLLASRRAYRLGVTTIQLCDCIHFSRKYPN